ncbi:MAG: hypothetical protein LCH56_15130 [Proteobacteria bacterium]|nr:hypothetical protein [Pseudomonadota bacterium]
MANIDGVAPADPATKSVFNGLTDEFASLGVVYRHCGARRRSSDCART